MCSKWGWCQWTTIYGEDGPSQGSAAPAGGRAGQCVTSDDCASRVPYCSKLGFCHGGRYNTFSVLCHREDLGTNNLTLLDMEEPPLKSA